MANDVSEQQKSGVLMNAEELSEWHEGYAREDKDNAQGWANENQLNQRRREETKMDVYTPKNNTGALHNNKFKKPGGGQPDFSGDVLVDGKAWSVGAWKNKDKNGATYLGLKFSEPKDQGASQDATSNDDFDF